MERIAEKAFHSRRKHAQVRVETAESIHLGPVFVGEVSAPVATP